MTRRIPRPRPTALIVLDDADDPAGDRRMARNLTTAHRLEPVETRIPAGPSSDRQAARGRVRRDLARHPHAILPTIDALGRDPGQIALTLDEALRAGTTVHVLAPRIVLVPRRAPPILGLLARLERDRRAAGAKRSRETSQKRSPKPGRPGFEWTPEALSELHRLLDSGHSLRDIAQNELLRVQCGDELAVPSRSAMQRALDQHAAPSA